MTEWIEESTGLRCLTKHGPLGNLNGYVRVERNHPLYYMNYHRCITCGKGFCYKRKHKSADGIFDVHGGLTYSDKGWSDEANEWWFGFDTAHLGDFVPSLDAAGFGGLMGTEVRDLSYVEQQCEHLAKQLHKYVTWRTKLWSWLTIYRRVHIVEKKGEKGRK